jgi:hypothetical protein
MPTIITLYICAMGYIAMLVLVVLGRNSPQRD